MYRFSSNIVRVCLWNIILVIFRLLYNIMMYIRSIFLMFNVNCVLALKFSREGHFFCLSEDRFHLGTYMNRRKSDNIFPTQDVKLIISAVSKRKCFICFQSPDFLKL